MTDYRALCAELLVALKSWSPHGGGPLECWEDREEEAALIARAEALLAKPAPAPTAWMYQSEPDFDGKHWHENWKTTLDEKLARYMAGKKEPIPLWCSPTPQPEPAPTDDELLRLAREWNSGHESIEFEFIGDYARAVLARWGNA